MTDPLQTRIESLPIPGTAIAVRDVAGRVRVARADGAAAASIELGVPVAGLEGDLRDAVAALVSAEGLSLSRL